VTRISIEKNQKVMSTACRCSVFSRHHRSTHLFHAVVFVLCANSFVKGKRAVASDPRDPTTGGLRWTEGVPDIDADHRFID